MKMIFYKYSLYFICIIFCFIFKKIIFKFLKITNPLSICYLFFNVLQNYHFFIITKMSNLRILLLYIHIRLRSIGVNVNGIWIVERICLWNAMFDKQFLVLISFCMQYFYDDGVSLYFTIKI